MIYKQFDPTDIVEGKTSKISSGFWPEGFTHWSSSYFEHGYLDLTNDQTPSTAYGSSPYDVRKTLFYMDVYPNLTYKNSYNEPFFSISYGHFAGNMGSGSFDFETGSIKAYPARTVYNQYKNLLLGTQDIDGLFSMDSGSVTINAEDIFVINFNTYKMKDRIDEGVFQISFTGSNGRLLTLIDDSSFSTQVKSSYQLIRGTLSSLPTTANYEGIGLLYPAQGIVVLNASKMNELLGLDNLLSITAATNPEACSYINSSLSTVSVTPSASYYSGSKNNGTSVAGKTVVLPSTDPRSSDSVNVLIGNQSNNMALFWSLKHSKQSIIVRKSEYVPSKHYFVRIKNRDFNYSNNPTYVYDGTETSTDGNRYVKGTIRNKDFYTDPKTYPTTVGLYNDENELIAVAKLSRPAVKTFDTEILLKIRLDF